MKKTFLILVLLTLVVPLVVAATEAPNCVAYCLDLSEKTANYTGPPKDESGNSRVCICNPLKANDFNVIINQIIDFIFKIAIVLVPLMVVLAGFLFVTAGGDPEKITRARSIIIWSAVGLAIILLSKGLGAIINQILGT